ncbi:alcohol dehydrogenase catalytic domain-containing protein [Neobacillus sp. 3P2-tot-E-2]|uniref:zinc-dependent alcohol dehydrogenase n=1 Tax=Neobacillus sp. 3P2-tot-E-2 TaxID=3132212 RepID=UPI0039A18511
MLELYLKRPYELELRESHPSDFLQEGDVKIRLVYGGICGSDLRVFQGKLAHASYPIRPGHELVGTIIEAGKAAPYKVGTRVVVFPNSFCGECDLCLKGKTNICRHKKSIGVNADGGFSEAMTISAKYVFPIPEDLTDERAILIEPFAVVVHALKKVVLNKDTTVAVVGSGNEGMLAVILANYLGAKVTAIDINPMKREMVRKLADIKAIAPDEVGDEKYDVVIEAAGAKSAVEQTTRMVRSGGAVVLIGMIPEAELPIVDIVRNEITLYGSIIYTYPDDFLVSMEYLRDLSLNIDPIITKILPWTEYQRAYEMALSGNQGKVVLDFK